MVKPKQPKRTPKKKSNAPPIKQVDNSWHEKFIELLGATCNVTLSARGAGVPRATAYEHYREQPEFKAQWDDAKEAAVEILEAEAWQRARKQSDTLMIFLLKAHNPAKYRERYEVSQTSVNINWDDLTEDELERIAAGESPAGVLASRSAAANSTATA